MEAIVEILDNSGACKERHFIKKLPAVIGRAYTSDIIVVDQYVCPRHLEISKTENGILHIQDLQSVNGIYAQTKKRKILSTEIERQEELRLGQTLIKIIDPAVPLAATIPFDPPSFWSKRIKFTLNHAFLTFFIFLVGYYVDSYLLNSRSGEHQNYDVIVNCIFGSALVFLPWASVWSLLGKVNINKPRFYAHFTIPIIVSFIYSTTHKFYSYIEYAFAQPALLSWFEWIFTFIAILFLFYYHLLYATKMVEKSRWVFSFFVSFFMVTIFILVHLKSQFSFSSELPLSYLIKPPWVRISSPLSIENFVDRLDDIKDDL